MCFDNLLWNVLPLIRLSMFNTLFTMFDLMIGIAYSVFILYKFVCINMLCNFVLFIFLHYNNLFWFCLIIFSFCFVLYATWSKLTTACCLMYLKVWFVTYVMTDVIIMPKINPRKYLYWSNGTTTHPHLPLFVSPIISQWGTYFVYIY